MSIWILVADNSRARLLSASQHNGSLEEEESLVHSESRLHERDLTSDLPGRDFDSMGEGRHTMGQQVDPKEEEAIRFADQLIDRLEVGRVAQRFDKLYVIAPPHLLGLLRERYGHLAPMVAGEIGRHLTQCTPTELRTHLPEHL